MRDESKLPKWAQDELRRLRSEVDRLERASTAKKYTEDDAPRERLYLYEFRTDGKERLTEIPSFARVVYVDDRGDLIYISADQIHRREDGVVAGGLDLMARSDLLTVTPKASNALRVNSVRWTNGRP